MSFQTTSGDKQLSFKILFSSPLNSAPFEKMLSILQNAYHALHEKGGKPPKQNKNI
jgi:hypothetical protein